MEPNINTRSLLGKVYGGLLLFSMIWAIVNCLYVYLARGGDNSYRLESAVMVLVALAFPAVISKEWARARASENPLPRHRALIAVAVGAWLLIALPLVTFPFLSDDYGFLHLYRTIGDAARPFQFYRPGFAVVFATLAEAGSGSPACFHAAAFLLHVGSAALVYSLARKLFDAVEPAVIAFVLFVLSPIQLESVLWVSGLQELLWTFFVLAALRCYIEERVLPPWRVAAVLALAACGLASKETAVCVALLLPSADALLFRFARGRLLVPTYVALAAEVGTYLLIRRHMVPADNAFFVRPSHYFVKQFLVMPYEILIHPWNVSAIHVSIAVLCVTALAGIGLFVAAVWRGAGRRMVAGPAIVIISTLPVYSLFYVSPELAGSRYLYFATAGFALLLAELLAAVVRSRALWMVCTVVLVVVLAVSLNLNARPWRTAGAFVIALGTGLREGRAAADITKEWRAHGAAALSVHDGVPQEFQGVGVLKNGYPEFIERAGGK